MPCSTEKSCSYKQRMLNFQVLQENQKLTFVSGFLLVLSHQNQRKKKCIECNLNNEDLKG